MLRRFPTSPSAPHPLATTLLAALAALLSLVPAAAEDLRNPSPPELTVTTEVSLRTDGPQAAADLYADLARQAGIDVVLDPTLPPRDLAIDFAGVAVPQALDRLTRSAGHFWVPLASNAVFIAQDTPGHRRQYENLVIRTFQLENTSVRDALTALRSLMDAKNIATVEPLNAIVLRDTPAKAGAADRLLSTLDRAAGALEVRVEVVALDPRTMKLRPHEPPRLDTDEWQRHRDDAEALASPWLGLDPGSDASFAMNLHPQGEKALTEAAADIFHRLEVRLASRLHPRTGDVSLETRVEWTQGHGEGAERHNLVAQRMESTLRLEAGQTYLMSSWEPLPALGGRTLVVAFTPHITQPSELTAADLQPFWVGTENQLGLTPTED